MAEANDHRIASTEDARGTDAQGRSATEPRGQAPVRNRLAHAQAIDIEPQSVEASGLRPIGDVPLADIGPDPNQPRKRFDREALADLAATIRTHGVLQPVTVRRKSDRDPSHAPKWILISGERRWRAAALAEKRVIPASERIETDLVSVAEAALIENVQRADLNPVELANHLGELLQLGRTQDELGALLGGRSKSTISKLLSLRDLPPAAQEALRDGRIQAGHGFLLKEFPLVEIGSILGQIEAGNLSVRQLEKLVASRKTSAAANRDKPRPDPDRSRLESTLGALLGTAITVRQAKPQGPGELRIHFSDNDVLQGLLERFGYSEEHQS